MHHAMLAVALLLPEAVASGALDYPIRPVPFTEVQFEDSFWAPRLETSRTVTLPYVFKKCEETGRISNFAKAGGLLEGRHEGIYFNDSDVFKIVEGAAYTLALADDPKLDAYLDNLIGLFAAAQEDDGYLYTARTIDPENPPRGVGPARWSNIRDGHELYNVGHLYEAAVAHYQATGKRTLLDVALKNANLVGEVFGPAGRQDPPGHQEIEIGLARLFRVTGERRYLNLAQFFIEQRGNAAGHALYGVHYQDHAPVLAQTEAVGHAVRAGYLYAGMADLGALSGIKPYIDALGMLWEDVVSSKLYLTGGIGARHEGESFGERFELPNHTAYAETCAAIANILWNHRLFLLHGDGKYMDVVERILYNGFLAGVSLDGDTFFYANPLEADGVFAFNQGSVARSPWFDCSCCPANVARFMPSLPGYACAVRDDQVYINLYVAGSARIEMGGQTVTLRQETRYPWDGQVRIILDVSAENAFTLMLRIPGWSLGEPVPSDLYRYTDGASGAPRIEVNGEPRDFEVAAGYAVLTGPWKRGDAIDLYLDMPVRRVECDPRVADNRGRAALERGPIVYCVEGVDHGGHVHNLFLADDVTLTPAHRPELLGGVTVLEGTARAVEHGPDGATSAERALVAIPYYAWAHRGATSMAVWIARSEAAARAPAGPALSR